MQTASIILTTLTTTLISSSSSKSNSVYNLNKNADTDDYLRNRLLNYPVPANNYYVAGVLFMVAIIGLLLYVNFFYEYTLSDVFYKMLDLKICCCLRNLVDKCSYIYDSITNVTDEQNNNSLSSTSTSSPSQNGNIDIIIVEKTES